MTTDYEQQQTDEIEALLAVYPDILDSRSVPDGREIKLDVAIELEKERVFEVVSSVPDSSSGSGSGAGPSRAQSQTNGSCSGSIQTRLTHLPPILLTVLLPPTYPATRPVIQNVHPRHAWLAPSLVRKLVTRLDQMWTEDETILWLWVEDIQSGAFLSSSPTLLPHPAPKTLVAHLTAHESASLAAHFSAQAYTCGICLTPQRGTKCVQLPCVHSHVFCVECVRSFWGLCVAEGEVAKVACPGVECVKARESGKEEGEVGGAEWEDVVRRVLSEEQVLRWKWLRIKQAAEKDPHTVPCPVRMCQAPVMRPAAAAEDESGWARLRTCDACGYAFCAGCRRTWHGPVSRCAVTRTSEFMEAYIALEEGDPRRRALEAQYGKKTLERMALEYRQEKENAAWLKEKTMACPGCETHVEKNEGCNHMTCARCAVHFCFRCGTKLRAESPYRHFEQAGSCYGKLFDYEAASWDPDEGDLLRFAV